MKIFRVFSIAMGICGSMLCSTPNQLQKVLHNKQEKSEKSSFNLQVASLVFCFQKEPIIKHNVQQTKTKSTHTFFIEQGAISDSADVAKSITDLNTYKNKTYSCTVVAKKERDLYGLLITLVFNPNEVQLTYELFDSISMQKCINIKLFDKKILNQLKQHEQPALVVASNFAPHTVIIDYGHGGDDTGARSATNILEKDVSLTIGSLVTTYLKNSGIDVYVTRSSDKTVPLDDRISYTNSVKPSLFVSIHANASKSPVASGIETFYLGLHGIKPQLSTLSDDEKKIIQALNESQIIHSRELASFVHEELLYNTRLVNPGVVDRRIKQSIAQVLLGVEVPSILVEVGFLSHPQEAMLLGYSEEYQRSIARGIFQGILRYFSTNNG